MTHLILLANIQKVAFSFEQLENMLPKSTLPNNISVNLIKETNNDKVDISEIVILNLELTVDAFQNIVTMNAISVISTVLYFI